MKYKWTYICMYIYKRTPFISIPLILIPATLSNISFVVLFSAKARNCLPFIRKLEELPSQRGFLGMQKHCFSWQAAVTKEFNRSQNICYGLISFPGRTVQHCKANVRTWVYIGKLKGNQASGFFPQQKQELLWRVCEKKKKNMGWGGGLHWKS